MSAPTLEILAIQVDQIERQVRQIRWHLEAHHGAAIGDSGHLANAVGNCIGMETLTSHLHACIVCAMQAQKPLPVCASDGKGGAA